MMHRLLFSLTKPLLHKMDGEDAHTLTLCALKSGLYPPSCGVCDPRLETTLWGRRFANPLGLAAGFDKNAEVIGPMLKMGFGFIEVGTVTPKPQEGNPRPRVFRDPAHEAVINRMGFPNAGMAIFRHNIERFLEQPNRPNGVIGINIGMNKGVEDPAADYTLLVRELARYADYLTVNISSPNTPGLRNLQSREHLLPLLARILEARTQTCPNNAPPLLVKLAPDLNETQQEELAKAILESGIDGLILTNTTLARPESLPESFRAQTGGLSGAPLTQHATTIIRRFYGLTGGKIPIIGAGGVLSAQDAYDKLSAGASLIQVYSGLVFKGPALVNEILSGLLKLMKQDGINHISDIKGKTA